VDRAYSLLTIKSIDDDARVITGIATSASTDRVGDIVDPSGAEFKLPIPLLWQHDAHQPIGEVFAARRTSGGIEISARLAKIDEPGRLKDRLDEAWQSIKSGLVRGLSIGFKSLEQEPIKGTYGLRFLKWLWLELSAVTIPANADGSILSVKSIQQYDKELAASGIAPPVDRKTSPGVSGKTRVVQTTRQERSMKKTIGEQIKELENTRAAKEARLNDIQTKALDEGRTKDESEKEEFTTLSQELKSIDAELVDLHELEKINVRKAVPVVAQTPQQANDSRGGHSVSVMEQKLDPGIGFARFTICKAASYLSRGEEKASEIATKRYPSDSRLHQMFTKATVAAGTTTDATWAGPLVDPANYAGDFVEFLRPRTILGRMMGLRNVPFNVRILGQTSGGSADWVGQGKPKPLTKFDFSATTLTWAKIAAIAVISDELARFSSPSAERLVRDALAAAVIERMDIDFIDPAKNAVSGVSPASITNGIAPMSVSGTDAAAVRADFQALFNAFILDNQDPTTAVLIMPSTVALALSMMVNSLGQPEFPGLTMNGGNFMGIPVITSQYAAWTSPDVNIVVLVNASDIFISDDGQVTIDASREAALEMLDTGFTQNQPTGASLVSLWQNNLIGLKAERYVNWARRRTEAVQWIQNVEWGNAGSPA
jgi:HK97 family phage major capsid protein/HK97 family phage prohead protease